MSKILVVDDDGFSRSLLADTVRALGHQVTAAADAREGLQVLASSPHDGVITDVRMPGWDGIELARRIALLPDAPPVILMSSDPDFDVHEEALRRGVRPTSFLQKPFDRVAVARAVNVLVQGDVTAPTGTNRPELVSVPRGRDDMPEWLQHVRGTVRELPPARVWYVAWRRQANGALIVRQAQHVPTVVGFKRGQVVEIQGLPSLLSNQLPAGVIAETLASAVGGAMAGGATLEAALAAVASDVARWMLTVRSGDVRFDTSWAAGPGAIPVPGAPPVLLASEIAAMPAEEMQRAWQAVAGARATARHPSDVTADRLGLEPFVMRAHRAATGQAVQALVYELSGGQADKRMQALRALDLLLRLNLLTLGA